MNDLVALNMKVQPKTRARLGALAAAVGENMNVVLDRMIEHADVREMARLFDKEPLIVI